MSCATAAACCCRCGPSTSRCCSTPIGLGGEGEGDDEDGEEDDGESGGEADENPSGLTLGDCIDVPALIEPAHRTTMPALLVGYIQASLSRPWSEVEGMIPDELAPFVLSTPGCQ